MIRPFTFVTLLLAGASGLYLYQTKHRAEVLDQQIAHTLHQVAAARERIGILRADWALLNEPDRLGQLAAQHLALQPLQPSRFVAAADLASRIPIPPPPEPPTETPVAESTPLTPVGASLQMVDTTPVQATPAPAADAPRTTLAAAVHVSVPAQPRPVPTRTAARTLAAQREPAAAVQHEPKHAAYSFASSAAPDLVSPSARQPVFAPVLRAVATPMPAPSLSAAQVGLVAARPSIPAVTSALGGFGHSALAPPVPVGPR